MYGEPSILIKKIPRILDIKWLYINLSKMTPSISMSTSKDYEWFMKRRNYIVDQSL